MGLQKSPRRSEMSDGGLDRTRMGGDSQNTRGSTLGSDVSGHELRGKAPTPGAGAKSPSVKKPAAQAARGGRISTSGQARGGPQQANDAVETPDAGTKSGRGRAKASGKRR